MGSFACNHCRDTKQVLVIDTTCTEETEAGSGIFKEISEYRSCPVCATENRKVIINLGYLLEIADMMGDYDYAAGALTNAYNSDAIRASLDCITVSVLLPLATADLVEDIRSSAEHEARAVAWGY